MHSEGSALEGHVMDAAGKPVAGAKVTVLHIETGAMSETLEVHSSAGPILTPSMPVAQIYPHSPVTTNHDGYFRWDKLPPGLFDISAKSSDTTYTRPGTPQEMLVPASSPGDVLKTYISLGDKETTSGLVLVPRP
jgi:hypothetical protein